MKRPLFILSLLTVLTVFSFNFLPEVFAFIISILLVLLSVFLIRDRELKAVFFIVLTLCIFTSSFWSFKNEALIKSTHEKEGYYSLAVYEVKENAKSSALRGKLKVKDRSLYNVSLYLVGQDSYSPGDIVNFKGTLNYDGSNKLSPVPYIEDARITSEGRTVYKPYYFLGNMRKSLNEASLEISPKEISRLFPSLLTGSKTYLTRDIKKSLYEGGIAHIAAVSGLHLSIILGFVIFVFRLKGKKRLIVSLFLCLFVSGISAFSPSILRASLMFLVLTLGEVIKRRGDGITSLSLFAVVISVAVPRLLFSLSTWFSCLSVFGILTFTPYIIKRLPERIKVKKPLYFFLSSLAVSFSASFMTLPACLYFFGSYSLLSVILNVFIIPVVTFLLPILWIETLFILLLGFHVPLLDFLLEKGFTLVISLSERIAEYDKFFLHGYNTCLVALIAVGAVWFSYLCLRNAESKKLTASVLIFALLIFGVSSIERGERFIFYPDSCNFVVVKDGERACLIGNVKKPYEEESMTSALKKYDVKNISSALISYDESAQGLVKSFLEEFNYPGIEHDFVDHENFLPYEFLHNMGADIKEDEKTISFDFDVCKILKSKSKCDIINYYRIKKAGKINVIPL